MALETGSTAYTFISSTIVLILLLIVYQLGRNAGGERSLLYFIAFLGLAFLLFYTRMIYIGLGELPSKLLTTSNVGRRLDAEQKLDDCQTSLDTRPTQEDLDSLTQQLEEDRKKFEDEKSDLQVRSNMLQKNLSNNGAGMQGMRPDR
jgi:hypothetical protein